MGQYPESPELIPDKFNRHLEPFKQTSTYKQQPKQQQSVVLPL